MKLFCQQDRRNTEDRGGYRLQYVLDGDRGKNSKEPPCRDVDGAGTTAVQLTGAEGYTTSLAAATTALLGAGSTDDHCAALCPWRHRPIGREPVQHVPGES
jgi:hypothetical protein